ncbi:MAG: CRISPR-associated protein Cse4, partial [Romboutsia sp.]
NISSVFFNKFLHTNYFTEPKDIKLNKGRLKEILISNRESLFSWFYKGNINAAKINFNKYSLDIIKNTVLSGYLRTAAEQYNLRYSVLKYFNGGSNMGDILKDTKVSLREKINSKETQSIQNDEEYYFAIGQIASYLVSLNKSGNKNHSILNPILNSKNETKLKEEIVKLFKKYNYSIKKDSKRFNNLYSMILAYKSEGKINEEVLLAGYLNSSLIYEKAEEKIDE